MVLKLYPFISLALFFCSAEKIFYTEPAYSGRYLYEQRSGTYKCAGCTLPLFHSEHKYDLGNGWCSFSQPALSKNVYYLKDPVPYVERYRVLCRGCNAHLGHVFHDGPPPKHLRYCINSISLEFQEQKSKY